jgi:hypothetical protein
MTSANITFDETEFIKSIIDKYNDDISFSYYELFDMSFYSLFPTDEIREAIHNKYYLSENYDSESLYSILSNKLSNAIFDEFDSIADTNEETDRSD